MTQGNLPDGLGLIAVSQAKPPDAPTPLAAALVASLKAPEVQVASLLAGVQQQLGANRSADAGRLATAGHVRLSGWRAAAAARTSRAPRRRRLRPQRRQRRGARPRDRRRRMSQMTDADRRRVQTALVRLGYYDGQVDGIFGPDTRAAIRRYQHELGAAMTGRLTAEQATRLVRRSVTGRAPKGDADGSEGQVQPGDAAGASWSASALAAALSWRIVHENARREVLQEAAVMMAQASAIRDYTAKEIEPLLADQIKVRFLPHTVPSWAAQTNLRALATQFPDYTYKEAALNPTNPADRATDWESGIIARIRRRPLADANSPARATRPTGPILSISRPIRITDKDCLTCHSTPSAAPASMIDLYGSANGFGWKLGDVIGAQIVSVPMQVALDRANEAFKVYLGGAGRRVRGHHRAAEPAAALRHREADPADVGDCQRGQPGQHGRAGIRRARARRDRLAGGFVQPHAAQPGECHEAAGELRSPTRRPFLPRSAATASSACSAAAPWG